MVVYPSLKNEQGPIFLIKGVFPDNFIDKVDLGMLYLTEALFKDNDLEVTSQSHLFFRVFKFISHSERNHNYKFDYHW